jgi:DNA-binding HxlR family transcriptional regulator
MRSYDQFCGLAKALDTIGDRWTLLIVRELLIGGPLRYTDIQRGLPGIATNLLADRLRALEEAGVIRRDDAAPPVATALFSLTDWGSQLRPIIMALGAWARPLLGESSRGQSFLSHWLVLPLETFLKDCAPSRHAVQVELRTGDQPMVLETTGSRDVRVRTGPAESPEAVLTGPPELIIGVLVGRVTVAAARARGLHISGKVDALKRFVARGAGETGTASTVTAAAT